MAKSKYERVIRTRLKQLEHSDNEGCIIIIGIDIINCIIFTSESLTLSWWVTFYSMKGTNSILFYALLILETIIIIDLVI